MYFNEMTRVVDIHLYYWNFPHIETATAHDHIIFALSVIMIP